MILRPLVCRLPLHRRRHVQSLASADAIINVQEDTAVISSSTDIFENLALEDWMYSSCTFAPATTLLLIWRDTPCIVIGRHQNPWTEANVLTCQRMGIPISRRNSGGGTVYHDLGNINFSFLTKREDYSRKLNLQFLSRFLKQQYDVCSEISPREDLTIAGDGNWKISGTASKLARVNAYHHCTLLVATNMNKMKLAIRSKQSPAVLMSRATSSIRSPVTNLSKVVAGMSAQVVMNQVAESYARHVFRVSPSNSLFPSLNECRAKLSSWDWVFGKTPRFSLRIEYDESVEPLSLDMRVNGGVIEEASVSTDSRQIALQPLSGTRLLRKEVDDKLLLWSLTEDDHLLACNVCKAADKLFEQVC